jgi:membrane fusion protein, heavy metal efflux system
MKNSILIITIPVLMCMYSCQGGGEGAVEATEIEAHSEGEIALTMEQFNGSGMKVGAPLAMMFSNEISANGTLSSSLSGRAKINTLIPGRVKIIMYAVGEQVNKGDALFQLESHEIIIVQQEYAEVVQQLDLLQSNYERQKSLSDEKIVAQKDFQKTESAYRTMLARSEGLKARLRMMNMDPAMVENGTILPVLTVRSPIGGVVTRQELVLGQFIEPQVTVMEVVDTRKLQLNLQVFERDLSGLVAGQTVRFYVPNQEEKVYEATLSHIGKSIDPETKTIQCIAQVQAGDRGTFVNNLYVESKIITCQREALAVPENALVREPGRDFAWIRVGQNQWGMTFRKVPVKTGVTRGGYTEILEEDLTEVLLEGAYSMWSED